jgi:16S rRNA (cytosine967-C5)-methyltransferase
MTDRERALQLLRRIERESLYASLLLHDETGFVRTLVLGVLRWRSRIDYVIEKLAKRPVDEEVLDVLRVGLYQLMFTDVARYAAVAETVALAPKRARGFTNAILRRATEADLMAFGRNDTPVRTAHPRWLFDRWTRTYGLERATRIAEANQEFSYPDIIIDGPLPPDAEPSQLVGGIAKLKGSSAGFYGIDEGSAVIAAIAAAAGGDILDLTAAPGGKTRFMALKRGANVVANDVSLARLRPLIGVHRKIVVSDARRPPFAHRFETVLLDAPCSATGTIRKNPELKWRLRESDLAGFAELQRELLASALSLAGGTCIYSTCSLEPEENDDVVAAAGAERADITPYVPEGARGWVEDGVLRLTPESGADGFTAFCVKKY